MDFTPTPAQVDAAALAAQILGDRCTQNRLSELEAQGHRFDRDLWEELGTAGLLGLSLPEEYGGARLGLLELTSLLEEAGKVVAPPPLATHATAAMAIAHFGTAEQQASWLPDAAAGASVLAVAVAEDHAAVPPPPVTTATRSGDGWSVTGTKTTVLGGADAALFLVPVSTDDGTAVLLVSPDDAGVT